MKATIGGSCTSAELTLPGFTHDICSTVRALARGFRHFSSRSPWSSMGRAVTSGGTLPRRRRNCRRRTISLQKTAQTLGVDGPAWERRLGSCCAGTGWSTVFWPRFVRPKHPVQWRIHWVCTSFEPPGVHSAQRWFKGITRLLCTIVSAAVESSEVIFQANAEIGARCLRGLSSLSVAGMWLAGDISGFGQCPCGRFPFARRRFRPRRIFENIKAYWLPGLDCEDNPANSTAIAAS